MLVLFIGLLLTLGGAYMFVGALRQWPWVTNGRRWRGSEALLGPAGTQTLYIMSGMLVGIIGMIMLLVRVFGSP